MALGHFIRYMGIKFVQNVDLRNKNYKHFLVKKETRAIYRKNLIFDFFSTKSFLGLLLQVCKHSSRVIQIVNWSFPHFDPHFLNPI